MKFIRLIARATLVLLAVGTIGAHAQQYPSRPVTIVVPSTPGGGFDLVGRVVADALGKQMPGKGFVVVENTKSDRKTPNVVLASLL